MNGAESQIAASAIRLPSQPSMDLCSSCQECICNEQGQLVQVWRLLSCAWLAAQRLAQPQLCFKLCTHHQIQLLLQIVLHRHLY